MPLEGGWEESNFFKLESFHLGVGIGTWLKVAVKFEFI